MELTTAPTAVQRWMVMGMRYKVLVSNGYDSHTFYSDDKEESNLIYRMAVNSNMFTYVDLRQIKEVDSILEDWSDDDD